MRRAALAALTAAALAAAAAAPAHGAAAQPVPLTVQAAEGRADAAARALEAGGLRVQRRRGDVLQVAAEPERAAALRRLPGVSGVRPARAAWGEDVVVSEGLARTGGDVLERVADGGRGLVIAVLDLGFGRRIADLQAAGELPRSGRLEQASFDPVAGIAGRNAYGNATNHGEIVAQTVYDYAPEATYLFVNYHTELDFAAAVEHLISRRPDIVVHSNNFLEGPFDGSGPLARAVDRAAAAGILWFNSAGNYAQRHWSGHWADADGDGDLDWPGGGFTFTRGAGLPITFALSWTSPPGGPPTDIDLVLEQLAEAGAWVPVAGSHDRQSAGARPSEQIVGHRPGQDGTFRLRARLASGPPPEGPLTLFTREIPVTSIGGTAAGSVPTPADAAGAIAVGAVDWRGNALKGYSSHGPADDGRLKPDLVAPTDTRVMGPQGPRRIGGTSNAAPNAAGAAALMIAAARRAGKPMTPGTVRAELYALALDLGEPGPDPVYGHGRVRVAPEAPRVAAVQPAPRASVSGRVSVRFRALSRSRIAGWELSVVGSHIRARRAGAPRAVTLDTRRLEDGWHLVEAQARDWPGNVATRRWAIRVDNTPPDLEVRRLVLGPPPRGAAARGGRPPGRPVRAIVAASDPDSTGLLSARAVVRRARGGQVVARAERRLRPGPARAVPLGRLPRGRYQVRLEVADRAGNATAARRLLLVP